MNEPKHTRGELLFSDRGGLTDKGEIVARGYGDTGEQANANCARLVRGWNLLNRLDEMGVSDEEAIEIIAFHQRVAKEP